MVIVGSGVDHSLVDAGLVVNMVIEHINVEHGIEKDKYNESKHEFRLDFVDSIRRSRTRSMT